jgi:hypothetical protein
MKTRKIRTYKRYFADSESERYEIVVTFHCSQAELDAINNKGIKALMEEKAQ